MRFEKARTIVAAALFAALSLCLIFGVSTGTLCGFGWGDIAAMCPVGALLSMVSSKSLIPEAVVCIVVAVVLVLIVGRAFCGWACPVSLWDRIKRFFKPVRKRESEEQALDEANKAIAQAEIDKSLGRACSSCGACSHAHKALDSRHAVLGGAILTSAIFGFPVFCLVCPVGLSFAAVSLLISLFGHGDLSWSLLFVPLLLGLEIVFFRKWCTRFCPISALISLFGRFSKTGLPEIDDAKCLETSKGIACSRCASVCKYDVNLRHPRYGELPVHDCARCMECVDACPADAISIRLVNKKRGEFAVQLKTDQDSKASE